MKIWSKIKVRKENIICPAENFYCAGIVNFTKLAVGSFRQISEYPTSPTMDGREPQTAIAKLSQYR